MSPSPAVKQNDNRVQCVSLGEEAGKNQDEVSLWVRTVVSWNAHNQKAGVGFWFVRF